MVTNTLAGETSPYLLQHADNPVHWYPWNPQTLARAAREDKPILLSIGYSACHWCHVMAHESFEDQTTAELMNAHFINIKVDREERPDIDKIYQVAHQILTRRAGGWPLTMFLMPDDQTPFFGGTYFPNEPRFGMPSFKDLLGRVVEFFASNRHDLHQQNDSLLRALQETDSSSRSVDIITPAPLDAARAQLRSSFDQRHGGFGGAPKFPHPTNLDRLFRHYAATACAGRGDESALTEAAFSLRKMVSGGLYDQVGGGFCRYSVDDEWMIPHFEKMLYDNGPLLTLCAEAWQLTGDPVFAQAARETGAWVMREMQAPDGGYYSTLDADSEGEEGKFYVWTPAQVRELLTTEEFDVVAPRFGLDRPANFEGSAWHFHGFREIEEIATAIGVTQAQVHERIESAKQTLYAHRSNRIWPGRDEKLLTSWNALMIKGMADAGRILNEPRFIESAEHALDYVRDSMWSDGRLLATSKDGRAHLDAYLDDYAFLIDAILSLLDVRWRDGELEFAAELAEVLLEHFQDDTVGGFFFTADDHERLIHRPKPMTDDALPAGNGIAAYALARLGHLLGEQRFLTAAEQTIRAGWSTVAQFPHACNALLLAIEEYLYPPQTIILRGPAAELPAWLERAHAHYAPRRITLAIPDDSTGLPGLLAERKSKGGVTCYVCAGHHCEAPIHEFAAFEASLAEFEVPAGN